MNVLCKVFNFFLDMFSAVLSVIVESASTLLGAAFTVLDELASSVIGSPVVLIGGAFLLWWFLRDKDKDKRGRSPPDQKEQASA